MTDSVYNNPTDIACHGGVQLLPFTEGEPIADLHAFLQELGRDAFINARIFTEFFEATGFSFHEPIDPGFITEATLPGVDCCQQNPQRPTVTGIMSGPQGDDRRAVYVTATHPCGIREISIFLGEGQLVRKRRGRGRVRVAIKRRRQDRSLLGDTWTRGDSKDATPQTAVSIFPLDQFLRFNNSIMAEVVSTCGTRVAVETDFFEGFRRGPF